MARTDVGGLIPSRTGKREHLESRRNAVRESAEDLLRSVWDEIAPDLGRLACALGVAPGRVEDTLQDVYLIAWQKHPQTADRIGLRRWLYRVTTNRCHLEHRNRTQRQRLLGRLVRLWKGASERGDAAEAASREEERELVRRALDGLEAPLRSVLVLRYFAEFDSKEIGRILELPDSTVRSRLRAGRRQLAAALKQMGYRDD
ncbi:MAG: RNA polymerase sigma factor [Planctomycetes bacterium]|nr:RNA polymerase sigma factor [Planctomycetota bacterium]